MHYDIISLLDIICNEGNSLQETKAQSVEIHWEM